MTSQAPDGGPANRPGRGSDTDLKIEELRSDLSQLASDVSELGASMVDQSALLELADRVTTAEKRMDTVMEELASSGEAGSPVLDWHELDQAQARREWERLWTWLVQYYVPTWNPTREDIPDCWTRHPAMRDLLSLLRDTHRAMHAPGAMVATGAQWHTMWRRSITEQLTQIAADLECRPGVCGDAGDTGLARPLRGASRRDKRAVPDEHWLTDGIEADVQARPEPQQTDDGDGESPTPQ